MIDGRPEKPLISVKRIEAASRVMPSPDHPNYSADRAVAIAFSGGKSGVIAAIDGVGSGGEQSAIAADVVQKKLNQLETSFTGVPTINSATKELRRVIFDATSEIKKLQDDLRNTSLDTTISAGIACQSKDGKRHFMVLANVGDSRVYRYIPKSGEVSQLTRDDSYVQALVGAGEITPEEAFSHPDRNLITKTVGSISSDDNITITVSDMEPGDVFIAVSDGVSDNLTPTGFPVAVNDEFRNSFAREKNRVDINDFCGRIAQRARNIMAQRTAIHAKSDDICVAALRLPR